MNRPFWLIIINLNFIISSEIKDEELQSILADRAYSNQFKMSIDGSKYDILPSESEYR